MRRLILKTVISLDGFLEAADGPADWFRPDDAGWEELFELTAGADTVLLGRVMYPGYARHWRGVLAEPAKHPPQHVRYARWADQTRHVVFSRTLQDADADWANTRIMRDAVHDVSQMKREAGKNLLVFGGATFAGTLIDHGLVDEYHLAVVPIALGGGKPLFHNLTRRRPLKLIGAKPLPSGTIWLSYRA